MASFIAAVGAHDDLGKIGAEQARNARHRRRSAAVHTEHKQTDPAPIVHNGPPAPTRHTIPSPAATVLDCNLQLWITFQPANAQRMIVSRQLKEVG
jgi:hypothetical protein